MTVNRKPKTFLGIELYKINDRLKISQSKYVEKVLEKFQMSESKPAATPAVKDISSVTELECNESYPVRQAIGSLLYLSSKTRPDICYAVNKSSRCVENLNNNDIKEIKRVFQISKRRYGLWNHI